MHRPTIYLSWKNWHHLMYLILQKYSLIPTNSCGLLVAQSQWTQMKSTSPSQKVTVSSCRTHSGKVVLNINSASIFILFSDGFLCPVGERTFAFCSHDVIPEASLLKLECRSESMAGVGKTVNIASVSQTLGKREYLNIENRKKSRADMKEKYILEGSNHNEDSE